MINDTPRVRFAPSPTGYLHVGGLRTALYNYLFAKKNNGSFILRIEDTDRARYVEGAVENLLTTMKWVGLDYNEGPDKPGEFGPYMQSERLDIYREHINNLLDARKAYYCFCTPERLTQLKEEQQKQKLPQAKYDKHCLSLSKAEIENKLKNNESHVIRLNVPPTETISFDDIIRGKVEFSTNVVDDQILIKSDGYPTYHMANVVDDHLMKITHVIRGEEWLSSTPKHVLLYKFLEWELPQFAHLPLLLNADKSKLSKRQGDVAVEDYKSKGYLKDALNNFVALLGWNAGDDQEFYYMDELIEKFSLERVNKSGAVFNLEKLNWLNGEHLKKLSNDVILELFKNELASSELKNTNYSDDTLLLIIDQMKERVATVKEFISEAPYLYSRPNSYDEVFSSKVWKDNSAALLTDLIEIINESEIIDKDDYETCLKATAEKNSVGIGKLMGPFRLALSGVGHGPGVYDIANIIGKDEVVERIRVVIKTLSL
ncbi:MAG: glutamate--tRNA ligase [Bacteroidetes bacterium]|nr:glutamate--tRNA ligase [Bacteroidota bacterium]